jgi:hypothetical protein
MFKVSPTSLQTFIDTPNCVLEDRVQYSTVHIPNVFCDGHLQIINFLVFFLIHLFFSYFNHQLNIDFLITLYKKQVISRPAQQLNSHLGKIMLHVVTCIQLWRYQCVKVITGKFTNFRLYSTISSQP